MSEAASNALLFEQEIDERVAMALMRLLTERTDPYGFGYNMVHALMSHPAFQHMIEERCSSYVASMERHWMNEGAKKYANSMTPRYKTTSGDYGRF